MQQALLLVDLQNDFLARPGMVPAIGEIEEAIVMLLAHARRTGLAVVHIRTEIDPSGADRMPHWKENDVWECVAGTPGSLSPPAFTESGDEPVFKKRYFSGFANPALHSYLQERAIEELWIAGVYSHGCVRATAMDAYERGYRVLIVEDAVASIDPLHARITRDYMDGRSARFLPAAALLGEPAKKITHFSPAQPELLVSDLTPSSERDIEAAIAAAAAAGEIWCGISLATRRDRLQHFMQLLQQALPEFEELLICDIGKPRRAAVDELERAVGHIRAALALEVEHRIDCGASVRYRARGCIAVVTPWNNPVAIPLGKITAALLLGNSIVWKPASEATRISARLLELFATALISPELVQPVYGGASQVAQLAGHPAIVAVSLTGSEQAGRAVAAICAATGKPLQAELGGNNAMLVLADADLTGVARTLAQLAFGYAGQRCTAIRRVIVERQVAEAFNVHFIEAVHQLQLFEPGDPACQVGPLISANRLARVEAAVHTALACGAEVLCGGGRSDKGPPGHYYLPTVLTNLTMEHAMVQDELFGPVAVLQVAEDFEHGLQLVNGVRQGLLAGIATTSPQYREEFSRLAQAGILIDGSGLRIHPAAPFGGCKASQIGPPEHGIWDREFFTFPQVRYSEYLT